MVLCCAGLYFFVGSDVVFFMVAGHISFSAEDIDLETYVTKNIKLKV